MAEGSDSYVDKLISNLQPKEVVYQRGYEDRFSDSFGSKLYTYRLDEWVFSEDVNREKLCKQFGTKSLKGFGVEQFTSGISAAGAILYYLEWRAREMQFRRSDRPHADADGRASAETLDRHADQRSCADQ